MNETCTFCGAEYHRIEDHCCHCTSLLQQLAASQAMEVMLREAISGMYSSNYQSQELRRNALAIPLDDSALQERLKQERERCAKLFEDADGAIHATTAAAWRDPAAAIRALT